MFACKSQLIAIIALLLLLPARAEEVRLFLVHTNDIHGHLEKGEESGGFVRVATVIRTLKAAFPGHVVVLDAGDMGLGTPTSGLFFGLPVTESMNNVGYDAVALGNHEFDWGQAALAKMMAAVGAPALCANLVKESDGTHPYLPSTVIERGGARLGVIGLVAPDTATRTPRAYTKGWLFQEAEPAAEAAIKDLPDVDAVIALTHIGVPADKKLAQSVPGISLIVGGHSHTALAEMVTENGVPIVQSGCYCKFVGVMEILVDTDANSLKVAAYHLVPIDDSIAPDPAVSAIVEGYAAKVRPILDRVVGKATADIRNKPASDTVDTPLGNLIADMLRAQAGTDVGLYNRGGVREFLEAGPVAVRILHELFPFDDPVVVQEATGAQLLAIVKQGAQTQARLSPSGLTATVNKATGDVTVEVAGQPLRPDHTYTLATTNFLATGGDKMSTLGELPIKTTMPFTREVVQAYVEAHPNLSPPPTGRVLVR